MGKYDPSQPLELVNFRCGRCRNKFAAPPGRIEDAPEREGHPWRYFHECEKCGHEAHQQAWEQNLMLTYGKQTGPRTPAGKAAVTANLAGHPTQEEAKRTRFNAMKHGLTAQVATYFPAKPGKYPACESCSIPWDECASQVACMKRTELFMAHHIAFETRDPSLLTGLRANLHANVQAIIDDMILAIMNTGVEIKAPQWYTDKDGGFHLAEYRDTEGERRLIEDVSAHPLLKVLFEAISRNSLSLSDLAMTPKGQDDDALLRGHLADESSKGENLLEYQRRTAEAQEGLLKLIQHSQRQAEPALIEQQPETRHKE